MLQGLGSKILVLNSLQAMTDLFDERASTYSNRPNFVFAGELMGLNETLPLVPYGQEWRALRKLAHTALGPRQIGRYHEMQEDIAASLCRALIDSPGNFNDLLRIAGKIMIAITYGIPASPLQREYIVDSQRSSEHFTQSIVPGRYMCDLLPFLKYAPSWIRFQREAHEGREALMNTKRIPFEQVKREMKAGSALPSLVQSLLSSPPDDMSTLEFERRLMLLAGDMFAAGSDTTHPTLLTFIMAMALNRDRQLRAQAEIDAVIGVDRLPVSNDRQDLPYVNAVIKETMRWQPVAPMGELILPQKFAH